MKCKEDYALFLVVLLGLCLWLCAAQKTDPAEVNALLKIKGSLGDPFNNLKNWKSKDDPCNKPWRGVLCPNTTDGKGRRHVTQLQLLNMNLTGNLASEIGDLQELRILNFMWNNITGNIPREIGSIATLKLLLLNGNKLSGPLPEELGNLRNLDRIQIDQNNIQGSLPKSFANLNKTKHFHMNNNSLSGEIPKELSRLGSLVHLLLDNNNLSGKLPPDLAKIPNLLILQLDNNQFENSEIPQEYGNIPTLLKLSLRNCSLHGPLPDFSSIPQLGYLDLSYNKLTGNIPSGNLSKAMTTIDLSHNNLNGSIPSSFSSLPLLQKLSLNDNNLIGSAPTDIGSNIVFNSTTKLLVDFRNNGLTNLSNTAILRSLPPNVTFLLDGNPVCTANNVEIGRYCSSSNVSEDSYGLSINTKCSPKLCSPPAEPFGSNCYCSYPFKVGYRLKSPGISAFPSYKDAFEDYITSGLNLSLDQVAVQSYEWQPGPRLGMYLNVFPLANQTYRKFNDSEILRIRDQFAGWLIPDSDVFGPYEWINFTLGEEYANVYGGSNGSGLTKGALAGVLVGTVLGTLIISALIGIVAFRRYTKYTRGVERRRRARKRVKVSGVRDFEFQEMASATNSFDASMKIGKGGYGDVYKGLLEDGTVVAIKRAREGSLQGEKEFANEIELLSRLHHRNLVSLVGYCDDQDEQMLVYEYMPNGTLTDHLSERLKQRPLTFTTRLRIALGAAKGIFYLHTEANPPIFHRDIKATNILLDERFNARVADFGLSRLAPQPELEGNAPGYVSTVVKGTPGYLDPEYFLTHKLTDKSDVYSFGVVLLELLTAMQPITNGKNLVREVLAAYTSRDIPSIIDPRMGSYPPECLEPFLKLSLSCCKDETDLRPSIAEVVQELTRILQCVAADEERESLQMSSNSQRDLYDPYLSSDVSGIELHSASDPIVTPR